MLVAYVGMRCLLFYFGSNMRANDLLDGRIACDGDAEYRFRSARLAEAMIFKICFGLLVTHARRYHKYILHLT